ncbi:MULTISPECIES: glycoside hydrolase family 9 protein [Clostridium]|uniref:glycoside hydrolase family 9 protein n=1 Tax=Clostridium TaxID=1485 RepID=UPI0008270966|nr:MULTISPECIES: glycoside hydrolase family 9 protein [Clostridium]PJI07792.1 cellulase [Clostridium sp. CT7]
MLRKKLLSLMVTASIAAGIGFASTCYARPIPTNPNSNYGTHDLLDNSTFEGGIGLPWTEVETAPAHGDFDISGGTFNITVTKIGGDPATGTQPNIWDVQFRHRNLTLQPGHKYHIEFTVTADKDCEIYPQIAMPKDPYTQYWHYGNWENVKLKANVPTTIKDDFTPNISEPTIAEFAFHIGDPNTVGKELPVKFSFDNIHLTDPEYTNKDASIFSTFYDDGIRVNQVGYYAGLEKKATVSSDSTTPIAWRLKDSTGKVVKSGKTQVFNNDQVDHASGDQVHIIDFSDYNVAGKGYTLEVDKAKAATNTSVPFNIENDIYSQLKQDAIKYFYHSRSGIAIQMPYCGRDDLARPAGHPSDVMGNASGTWYSNIGNYTKDVTGGWYDAGDHGKYVVNGGISVWTMMNQYERALYNGDGKDKDETTKAPFADKTMNIPESGNGTPDILDEARWQMEMMLKLQVTPSENSDYAGMVHHKACDESWTGLGIRPDQDTKKRYLQPPSTSATLNLAATAAQSSRIWKTRDAEFSTKCLTAAESAWQAALKHPKVVPGKSDIGGGAYYDDHFDDEFYWAACELYATTGKQEYLDYIQKSPYYLTVQNTLDGGEAGGQAGCFDWGNTATVGTITLATVPNNLPSTDVAKAKANIEAEADKLLAEQSNQGYGTSLAESMIDTTYHDVKGKIVKGYPWGSNSFVANDAIVMAYAYDFSKDAKYINGVAQNMDYLLGRNPNVQSYVTGYGTHPLLNPHHRFFAHQADPTFPTAPAGCLSGGPNTSLQDPYVKSTGWQPGSQPAEQSYIDNIEAWSTNEITINWNAPMAWLSSYMDDVAPNVNPTPEIKKGDLNGDGVVNVLDLITLKRYLKGTITSFPNGVSLSVADINGDGTVNVLDLIALKKMLK